MNDIKKITDLCKEVRLKSIELVKKSGTGHIGSAFSIVELLVVIYELYNPIATDNLGMRNRFVLSKGHGALSLYALLMITGVIDESENGYLVYGSELTAFPCGNKELGLDFSSGSLGHGLSVASGIAYGLKNRNTEERVFAILSDGECQEGSTWEAAQFAGHHKLSNLTCIVDLNGLQATGAICDILSQDKLPERFEAFGFNVLLSDGHNIEELCKCLEQSCEYKNAPTVILAKTIKGKGVSFMENSTAWHYLFLTSEQADRAILELRGL